MAAPKIRRAAGLRLFQRLGAARGNVRADDLQLPFLPLGKSETWLQIHIYLGFFTTLLFLIHLNFRLPQSWFAITLAWLFVLVSGSGVVGLFFSRVLPRRLATRGGEVIFEKIPALRHALKTEAENGSRSFSPSQNIPGCTLRNRGVRSAHCSPSWKTCAVLPTKPSVKKLKTSPRWSGRKTDLIITVHCSLR